MILVDANLLIYAGLAGATQHARARAWLVGQINSQHRVGLPWASLAAFLRVTTNPRIVKPPVSVERAWQQVEEWLSQPNVWTPGPGDAHAGLLGRLLLEANASGNLVSDAHLAAIAIEHGLLLCSTDGDFARFPGLRWHNPLAPSAAREPVLRYGVPRARRARAGGLVGGRG